MTISTPPTAPARTDPNNFSARMDAYLAWIGTDLVPGLNTYSGMTNSGQFTDGSAAGPGITFTSDADTGMYRVSANVIGFATGGALQASISSSAFASMNVGQFARPSDFWSAGGAYYEIGSLSTPIGAVATQGANAVSLTSNGYRGAGSLWVSHGVSGTTGAAQITADPTGYVSLRAEAVKATGAPVAVTEIARAQNAQFLTVNGTAADPAYAFISDLDTGMYRVSSNVIGFATGGVCALQITAAQEVVAVAPGGIGYGAGSGGVVAQATSRTTGVTINTPTGAITLFSAAGSTTAATFTVSNSTVDASDTVIVSQKSGTNLYHAIVTAVAANSFNITFYTTGGTSTDAPVFNFAVIKGATA